jgi:hypothetical protein
MRCGAVGNFNLQLKAFEGLGTEYDLFDRMYGIKLQLETPRKGTADEMGKVGRE